jgi:hypothetical protein
MGSPDNSIVALPQKQPPAYVSMCFPTRSQLWTGITLLDCRHSQLFARLRGLGLHGDVAGAVRDSSIVFRDMHDSGKI